MKNNLDEKYKNHEIFSELTKYIEFYDSLNYSTFSWIISGVDSFHFNGNFLSSMKGTITSIKLLLECGNINDAFSLLRKYQDISVMHIYSLLYLENNFSIYNFKVEEINNWVKDEKKSPKYKTMINYIANSEKTKKVSTIIQEKNNNALRKGLNNHAHYNLYSYLSFNGSTEYDPKNNRITFLNQFLKDVRIIYISHFIWLFTTKEEYMMASDYVDYLDMEEEPPENSQYWVSPFIQEMFNDVIRKNQPDLSWELKKGIKMDLK